MPIPVRCMNCGNVLADLWRYYQRRVTELRGGGAAVSNGGSGSLLILDEATEGLAPLIREEIWRCLRLLREAGQTLLVVDKYVSRLVEIADHHVILEKGQVAWRGTSAELAADRSIWHRYLGV